MNYKQVKQKFGIIGDSVDLNRAINISLQVASTDISVLINGESGTGKENIPKIIHQNSQRKHNEYVAVNCGAIPEGTIDSELFGHEKGSFTGAHDQRKGYFEAADNGTIFLDEVAELPISTQARLLRVLESGEFMKVGSSKSQKTNVRVIAATNVDMGEAVKKGKFREDLYYRLNTINIKLPPLRERGMDIYYLFRRFAADFAEKYNTPPIRLQDDAVKILLDYSWPGNIRQLKNFVAQLSVIEKERTITQEVLRNSLPEIKQNMPTVLNKESEQSNISEREILYKVLFDMKRDLTDLKKITLDMIRKDKTNSPNMDASNHSVFRDIEENEKLHLIDHDGDASNQEKGIDSLSLFDHEKVLIEKALQKHKGKRRNAAKELGISERTLYRKLKEFNL
tara:strand:- start:2762 stop:3949 length:1188 start_codon:yes stop_codon:yes gene_type:complete